MAECLILGVGSSSTSDDVTATADQVLAPYTAITADSSEPVEGTIPSKSASTYNTSTSDQIINSGQYLSGNQTIKGVTTSNISAGNIKKGIVVKVGDANDDDRIKNVTGTYTTVSSGQNALIASALLPGYSGFANGGNEVKGSMSTKSAQTYYPTTSNQTISSGVYLSGNQTIHGISQTNLTAANIRNGVNVLISNGSSNIYNVTGTCKTGTVHTMFASHAASQYNTASFTMPQAGTAYYAMVGFKNDTSQSYNIRVYVNNNIYYEGNSPKNDSGYLLTPQFLELDLNKNDVFKIQATASSVSSVTAYIHAIIVY